MKKIINIKIFALIFLLLFLPLFVGCWGVPPTNESPTITSTPITVATVDELYTYDVDATDPDDDTLTYTLTTSPTGMTINSTTGVINWTPTSAQIGDNNVTAKVSDGSLNGTQSFVIVVSITTENQPPTITSTPINAATVGVLYTYYVNATDPDGDTLTYALTTSPTGMTINSTTGVINWTPTSAQIGDNNVTAKVSDGDLFDTQSFIITVNPPCDADKPTVITSDVTNIGETTVTANGNITATGGENCTVRGFQYGLTQTPTWDVQSSGSFGTGSYSEGLSGLTCETTYYVRAYTTNCAGTSYGEWKSFITAVCPPPQVTTNDASSITPTSAQLNGNLDSTGGLSCQVWFEYGETTSYGSSTTKQSKSSVGSFIQAISSLDSNTTYHFRACASNTEGTVYGADKTFTTQAKNPGTAAFSDVTTNSIRANWTVNGNPAGTQYYCENTTKGTNSGWTTDLDWNSTGLSDNTTYHFQVKAKNADGVETSWTDLGSQKTDIIISPPQVTTNNASGVISNSAQLNGNLDDTGGLSCDVWFEYGETTSYGSSTTKQSKSSTGPFDSTISSLTPNTTYHFRACASNTEGTVEGADKEFTTTIGTANLKLTPATQSVPIGTEGTVSVVVENVTNLMGADITLNFDNSKLRYDSAAVGSFWLPEGVLIFSAVATGGSVNIQLSAEPATVKSGSGTIITVTFERIASGVTDICFGSTDLRDEAWQVITHTKGGCCSFTE